MLDRRDILHEWNRREIHREFWLENLEERNHFEYFGVDERVVFKRI